jgi:hypothetical protein
MIKTFYSLETEPKLLAEFHKLLESSKISENIASCLEIEAKKDSLKSFDCSRLFSKCSNYPYSKIFIPKFMKLLLIEPLTNLIYYLRISLYNFIKTDTEKYSIQ